MSDDAPRCATCQTKPASDAYLIDVSIHATQQPDGLAAASVSARATRRNYCSFECMTRSPFWQWLEATKA